MNYTDKRKGATRLQTIKNEDGEAETVLRFTEAGLNGLRLHEVYHNEVPPSVSITQKKV
jgi:hypothetical protein